MEIKKMGNKRKKYGTEGKENEEERNRGKDGKMRKESKKNRTISTQIRKIGEK